MADSLIEIPGGSITPAPGGGTDTGIIRIIRPYDLKAQIERLAVFFGVGPRTDGRYYLADIFKSLAINKWSKIKPIEYPQLANLSPDQFKGTLEQNRNNIYYGLKVPQSAPSTQLTEDLVEMHDATFDYVARPTSWKRILDFNGYDHYAEPNPYASFNSGGDALVGYLDDADFETGGLSGISIRYSNSNTTGVDFSMMLQDPSESIDNVLTKAFPCILITDARNVTYLTALFVREDSGVTGPRPLLRNGLYAASSNWFVKFAKPVYSLVSTGGSSNPPWTSVQDNMKATIILVQSASATTPLLTLGGVNFGDNWLQLGKGGFVSQGRPVVVPGGVGQILSLRLYNAPSVVFAPRSVILSVLNSTVQFIVAYHDEAGGSASNITVECSVTLSSPQGGPYNQTQTFSQFPPTSGQATLTSFIIPSNLMAIGTMTYTGRVSIRTTIGTKYSIRTMDFSQVLTS